MKINEIFHSIQGEGPNAGRQALFIRTYDCNLSCKYCDTLYAKESFKYISETKLIDIIKKSGLDYITITGGEPLLQRDPVLRIVNELKDIFFEIQTNGTIEITADPDNIIWAMDIKTPSSGGYFNIKNLGLLGKKDWVNFVISNKKDIIWALDLIEKNDIRTDRIYFTPEHKKISPESIVRSLKGMNPHIRIGVQLHKIIWGNKRRK